MSLSFRTCVLHTCVLIFLSTFLGCGYTVHSVGYPHIKTVTIPTIDNRTYETNIGILATKEITEEFIFDGSLKVVKGESADSKLSGAITEYVLEPISIDTGENVQQYRLRIVADLKYEDVNKNKIIWRKYVEGDFSYPVTGPNAKTEGQARKSALDDLAQKVVAEAVEIW